MTENPAQLNSAGLQALARGDAATAVTLLRRAVAADPAAALLWYNLANALAAAGDAPGHAEAIDHALDRDPFLDHALLARGRIAEAQGDLPAALELYQRLIAAVDPRTPQGPGFTAGLAHARSFVTAAQDRLAAALDTALAPALADVAPEDSLRFRHAVEIGLGRRRVYNAQPLVMAYPYLPAEQFLPAHHFPWFAQLSAAAPIIRAELQALLADGGEGFAPYVAYPRGAPVNQWGELNHDDRWAAQFLLRDGLPQAEARARCPQTAALLDTLPLFDLPGRGPVAFFSLLKPHTRIPPHTGATNIRTIVHLPLIVPPGCGFRVGNETRRWVEGTPFAFDDAIEHEAWNDSDDLRAVLIIDCWNPHLTSVERDLLRTHIQALDAAGNGLAGFA